MEGNPRELSFTRKTSLMTMAKWREIKEGRL